MGKKRKRNTSSDNSDVEVMPAQSPREDEESSIQVKGSQKNLVEKKTCLIMANQTKEILRDCKSIHISSVFLNWT